MSSSGSGKGREDAEEKDLPPYATVNQLHKSASRTSSSSKKHDSAATTKKSPYAATLQKLKRKVRKTHSSPAEVVTEGEVKKPTIIYNRHIVQFKIPDQPSTSEDSQCCSSSSQNDVTPDLFLDLKPKVQEEKSCDRNLTQSQEKDEDKNLSNCQADNESTYSYETADKESYDLDSISNHTQPLTPESQPDLLNPSEKEDTSKETCVYINLTELFQRPNNTAVLTLGAPYLYFSHNETGQTTTAGVKIGQDASSRDSIEDKSESKKFHNYVANSSSFCYSDPYFPSLMQDSIRELALDGQFADVTIEVENQRIKCHRIILSASSKYFKAMFCNGYRERDQSTIVIQAVSAEVMKVLIRYAYTSHLEVSREMVQSVLEAASLLQFTRVMDACSNYFVNELAIDNAPGFMELAHRHNLDHLLVLARLKCVTCFNELREKSDYLNISAILLESLICRSDLMVRHEEEVFEVVVSWCQHALDKRKQYLPDLLKHVKLPLVDPIFFVRHIETHQLIRNNPDVFDLMMETRRYRTTGDIKEGPRIVPRQNATMHQVFATVGGCNKDDQFISEVSVLDFQHKTRATLCQMPNSQNSIRIPNSDNQVSKTNWAEFACTSWRENIVISGGKESRKESWMFITSLRQWVQLGNLNNARWRHRMVVCCGELYAVGGYDGLLRVNSLEKYFERENVWLEKRQMREGVSSAAVCDCNEMIYVIGGGPSLKVSTEKVQVYDPSLDSWSVSTPLPEPAKCINAVSLRGIIYVAGGTLRQVLSFDSTTEIWCTIGDPLLSERASCGVTLCNDRIFIVGGRDEDGKAISNVSYLDPVSKTIRSECNMSLGISHHGCITLQKFDQIQSKSVSV